MNSFLAVLILIAITGALLTLPLLPALKELKEKADAAPLNVIQQNAGEVRHFADSFRAYLKGLEPDLERSSLSGITGIGTFPDGTAYMVLTQADTLFPTQDNACPVVLAACDDLVAPAGITFPKDIYTRGHFAGGKNNTYRAILSEKNLHLGASSRVTRWLHAAETLTAESACTFQGRISSDRLVRLQRDCSFSRVHAPLIATGDVEARDSAKLSNLNGTQVAGSTDRLLYDGDFAIAPRDVIHANIVVRGNLVIGAGARVYGSLKSGKNMTLEDGVCVEGSLISAERMHIGRECSVYGPIIAERGMFVGSATVCGGPSRPTTVTSPAIEVQEGALVFGTLWAREFGRVVGAA